MLMEPWDKPRPPTRVWCLFEGNTTIAKGGQLEVVLGRKQQRQLQKALEDRFVELEDNLSQIDARRAEATVIADRAAIFDAVEDAAGDCGNYNCIMYIWACRQRDEPGDKGNY